MIKFIADGMNGDLAKWLRILGYDCIYPKGEGNYDQKIVELAIEEDRVVLTADKELFKTCVRRGVKVVYTPHKTIEEKLSRVIRKLNLPRKCIEPSRCTLCNFPLKQVDSSQIEGKIAKEIINRYQRFWLCMRCGKVYWEGSHWSKISETIKKSFELSSKSIDKVK